MTLSCRVIAMKTHLHITNGDVAADALKQSNIRGDVLPWRDPMVDGPFPTGLDLAATSKVRADYLSGPALPHDQVLRDFRLRDDHLAAAAHYDGVTLWFEHDLLDQLQILQVLDWFADAEISHTQLGIICVDAFPGILPFRGLGQLDPAQIATLIDKRVPVTPAQLELAQAGWAAFRSPDPREIETYLQQDLRVFPFMKAALLRHLQEIPSVSNGLGRTDQQILQLISDGIGRPGRLFAANMDLETNLFLGDWSFFQHIQSFCNVRQPLLRCDPNGEFVSPPELALPGAEFLQQRLSLTENGCQVLAGAVDASMYLDFDYWLGGVHFVRGKPMFRWNAAASKLELTQ